MDREEAIEQLQMCKDLIKQDGQDYLDERDTPLLDMAIEALQAQTDGDLISRADALKPFYIAPDGTRIPEVDCDNFPVEFSVEFIKKHLMSLPSTDKPTGKWIKAKGVMPPEFHGHHFCSKCGNFANMEPPFGNREDLSEFCPNCGVYMKVEGNE